MNAASSSREDRVRARAYALWEEDGRPDGRSEHHWHQAKGEIEREDGETIEGGGKTLAAGAKKRKPAKAADPHPGMMGDGTEEQNLGQEGDPTARITEAEVKAAFEGGKRGA